MGVERRAQLEAAAVVLLLFSAILDPRLTLVLAVLLLVAILGTEVRGRRA